MSVNVPSPVFNRLLGKESCVIEAVYAAAGDAKDDAGAILSRTPLSLAARRIGPADSQAEGLPSVLPWQRKAEDVLR